MKLEDLDYPLPKELIAQTALEKRDDCRLLLVDKGRSALDDSHFASIVDHIPEGDVLVLNDTKVIPAALAGKKKITGGKVELLLLSPAPAASQEPGRQTWRCLLQPVIKEGQEIVLASGTEARFVTRGPDGIPLVEFHHHDVLKLAHEIGRMPLPPYIKRAADDKDSAAYQTVFAKNEGAVASPTAGLHFTEELLAGLRKKGVEIRALTLHVGYGTFKPVEDLEGHKMHAEVFELPVETAETVNRAKADGRKVWAVGTTVLRVLETCVKKKKLVPGKGETDLYIKPPFEFEVVDRLITNFHLPKTTLLLLVSAFMGEALRKKAYEHAIAEKYRFYSYGDAMLIY